MNDMKLEAKMKAAQKMREIAKEMMHKGLRDGMQKVSVTSDSKEGLSKGLEEAKKIASKGSLADALSKHEEEETPEDEASESPELQALEDKLGTEEHPQEEMGEEESPEEEASETPEEEYKEILDYCNTPEKVDTLIKQLEAKKLELMK